MVASERLQDRRSALDESYGYAETEKGGRTYKAKGEDGRTVYRIKGSGRSSTKHRRRKRW